MHLLREPATLSGLPTAYWMRSTYHGPCVIVFCPLRAHEENLILSMQMGSNQLVLSCLSSPPPAIHLLHYKCKAKDDTIISLGLVSNSAKI